MHTRKDLMPGKEWSPDQIREQLSRIQSSDEVSSSGVLQQFLKFVVEETLAGRAREIKEYTIGIHALGRPPDFNPQIDAIVRIHAGRLRRVLYQYYSGAGRHDPIRIEMPKGAYVPVFIANEGESIDAFTSEYGYPKPERTRDDQSMRDEQKNVRDKLTIAVLPFQNLSDDSAKDHFAIGLGEQMSTELSRFQDIAVVSYYSTSHYTADTVDMERVGGTLGAHYIVTGSVRNGQEGIRVSVQLIFARTGEQVWATNYDRKPAPATLQEISDEIIEQVAPWVAGYYGIITREMAGAPQWRRAQVLGGHDAVSWYFYHQKQYNEESLTKAMAALEQALAADPNYALAWAILGELHLDSYLMELAGIEAIKKAFEYGRNAMRLDRQCLHAYHTIARAYLLQHDREGCIQAMEECFAINPNATDTLGWKGVSYILLGEYEKGKKLIERAIPVNPFYPWCYSFSMALYYYWQKDYTQALSWSKKINMPSLKFDGLIRAAVYGQMKDGRRALEAKNELLLLWPSIHEEASAFLDRFILHREMVTHILEGLRMAGIGKVKLA
jgi:TolB-like protein